MIISNGGENLIISQNPLAIFQRTKLTNTNLSLIQSKVGKVDVNTFNARTYSKSVTIYSAKIIPIENSKSIVSKLMITDQFINNKHVLTAYISTVESFNHDINVINNTEKFKNGKTILLNLNIGVSIESIIENGFDKGVTIKNSTFKLDNTNTNEYVVPFSTCFADCVANLVSEMSWLERVFALLILNYVFRELLLAVQLTVLPKKNKFSIEPTKIGILISMTHHIRIIEL